MRTQKDLPIFIENHGELYIADSVYIAPFVSIICWSSIVIDEATQIGPGVGIFDFDHSRLMDDYNRYTRIDQKGITFPIHIGKRCWIGANSVILKGVTLGDDCIVGAGSVVTHSYPDGSVIYGNPATYG